MTSHIVKTRCFLYRTEAYNKIISAIKINTHLRTVGQNPASTYVGMLISVYIKVIRLTLMYSLLINTTTSVVSIGVEICFQGSSKPVNMWCIKMTQAVRKLNDN